MSQKFSIGELYILHELMKRNETQYNLHCKQRVPLQYKLLVMSFVYVIVTIQERLQEIYEYAGERKLWYSSLPYRCDLDQHTVISFVNRKTLRLVAALLHKVVDSLAPALTSMLVRGKEVHTS